jgi:AAA family ATP:ADP antiporter
LKALRPGEAATLVLSFLYFLLLLASYYILRPVRDSLVAGIGTDQVKFLSVVVLTVMLAITPIFGGLMARVPRYKLLPGIYAFAVANLLLFAAAFSQPEFAELSTRVFYVWVTVFNLFVISVFWSFMADIWNAEQGRRLFGVIAAGGSLGGLLGPTLAQTFATRYGNSGLTVIAALLLSGAIVCLFFLGRIARRNSTKDAQLKRAFGGSSWQGILLVLRSPFLLGIATLVMIGSFVAMFTYIELGRLAKEAFEIPEARTAFFADIDFWTNLVALVLQAVVVGILTTRFGIKAPLLSLAIIGCASFVAVALSPVLATLSMTNVIRRAAEYGLGKPGRDMLYTVATPQEKYLAKNVIDTVLYRGIDVLGSWTHSGLLLLGFSLAGIGWVGAAGLAISVLITLAVARGYQQRGGH